jgi:hypothetical protein
MNINQLSQLASINPNERFVCEGGWIEIKKTSVTLWERFTGKSRLTPILSKIAQYLENNKTVLHSVEESTGLKKLEERLCNIVDSYKNKHSRLYLWFFGYHVDNELTKIKNTIQGLSKKETEEVINDSEIINEKAEEVIKDSEIIIVKTEEVIKNSEITTENKSDSSNIIKAENQVISSNQIKKVQKKNNYSIAPLIITIKGQSESFSIPTELFSNIYSYLPEMEQYKKRFISKSWLNLTKSPELKLNPNYLHLYAKTCNTVLSNCIINDDVENYHARSIDFENLLGFLQISVKEFRNPKYIINETREECFYFRFTKNGLKDSDYQKSSFTVIFRVGFNDKKPERKKISFKITELTEKTSKCEYKSKIIKEMNNYLKDTIKNLNKNIHYKPIYKQLTLE